MQFKPDYLYRKLLTWLMLRLNPKTMKLELGGGKEIAVTKHSIWCAFQIPKASGDLDAEARARRNELGQQIYPTTYAKTGIRHSDIVEGLKTEKLTGDLGLRAFFMAAFQCLLSGTRLILLLNLKSNCPPISVAKLHILVL